MTGVMLVVCVPTTSHERYLRSCTKHYQEVKHADSVIDVEPFHSTFRKSVEGEDDEELLEDEENSKNADVVKSGRFRNECGKDCEAMYMEKVSSNRLLKYLTIEQP